MKTNLVKAKPLTEDEYAELRGKATCWGGEVLVHGFSLLSLIEMVDELKEKQYDELLEATDQITANRNSLLERVEKTEDEFDELKKAVWEYLRSGPQKTVGGDRAVLLKKLHKLLGELPLGTGDGKWIGMEEEVDLFGWAKKK